jgi:glutamate synthase domain-containing protein 3
VAACLLADWDGALERFVKVMPRDYARVLREQAEAAEPMRADDEQEAVVDVVGAPPTGGVSRQS